MRSIEWHKFSEFSVGFNAPDTAGVYWIRNLQGWIIYIGKSENILNRLIEHLNNRSHCMHRYGTLQFWFREIPDNIERDNWEKIWIEQVRPACNRRAG